MSYARITTRNNIGVRQDYSRRALFGLGVHRAPAETPPVSAYHPTHPLSGARDYNTQSATHALGAAPPVATNYVLAPMPWRYGSIPVPSHIVRLSAPGQIAAPSTPPAAAPPPSSQTTPTPTTTPTTPAPTGVAISSGGPAASTAQAGTPVPVGTPTDQSYTDQSGNIWTFTPSAGWQVTSSAADQAALAAANAAAASSAAAGSAGTVTPGTTVTVSTGNTMWQDITSWLQGSSFSLGTFAVPNVLLVAGVGLAGLWLYSGKKR